MRIRSASVFLFLLSFANFSYADMRVNFIGQRAPMVEASVTRAINAEFDMTQYREMRVKVPAFHGTTPDHAVVYLFSKKFHRFDVASVQLDQTGRVTSVAHHYHLQTADRTPTTKAQCPDASVQFIAFAPNDDSTEQGVTVDVANEAKAKGLKTVELLLDKATSQNYLNYMSCPNLIGNFYDGDSNPDEFVTADGSIAATDLAKTLPAAFRFKVTNIWLACEAFNNPMLSTVIDGVQAQKFAAGINDLEIGPSDNTGACAMKAAIDGQPMKEAFMNCYKTLDNSSDQWGFDGKGADMFGQ